MQRTLHATLTVLTALTALAGCRANTLDLAPKNPLLQPTPTPLPPACPYGLPAKFEDFESAAPLSPAAFGNGAVPSSSWDTAQSHSPSHSWKLTLSGLSGWGGGINAGTNDGSPSAFGYPVINAHCATQFSYAIRSDTGITGYTVRFRQAGNAATFKDANWLSPAQNAVGDSAWHVVTLPIAGFTQDPYGDAGCAGSCGGIAMDLDQIQRFEISFPAVASANVWIDDIQFQ